MANLQSMHATTVDKLDAACKELDELKSCSKTTSSCESCSTLSDELVAAKDELLEVKKRLNELEKKPALDCLTCPQFIDELQTVREKVTELNTKNVQLCSALSWMRCNEPQLSMIIPHFKKESGARIGRNYSK